MLFLLIKTLGIWFPPEFQLRSLAYRQLRQGNIDHKHKKKIKNWDSWICCCCLVVFGSSLANRASIFLQKPLLYTVRMVAVTTVQFPQLIFFIVFILWHIHFDASLYTDNRSFWNQQFFTQEITKWKRIQYPSNCYFSVWVYCRRLYCDRIL